MDFSDALNFHATRSGHFFSPWEDPISGCATFDIASSVTVALDDQAEEDLCEADTCEPVQKLSESPSPPAAAPSSSTKSSSRKARDKERSRARRAAARSSAKIQQYTDLLPPARRPGHIKRSASPVKTRLELLKHRVASIGWIGLRDDGRSVQEEEAGTQEEGWVPTHFLPDFFGTTPTFPGFRLVKYLGPNPRPVADNAGKIYGVHAGHPDDPTWMAEVHDPAVKAMEEARVQCAVSEARTYHRRGNWPPLTAGDSYGGGQTEPGALVDGVINTAVLCCLLSNIAFIRIAGFATGVFANWAPSLFDYYVHYMRRFYAHYTHLSRPFLNGIWSACTFNLGPRTCALGHRDFANLAFGWCAITALGDFDYTKGGHLILWDCRLVLEFPPGTTILIPSAALFHSNIPISDGERRYSFTQYTAGGLFRWVEHGFQSEESYFESLSPEDAARERAEAKARWAMGAGLFSTLDELKAM
ncbi:hypothetical protein DFH09DRAFT_1319176 [Mycena vulgaris]|nr:hypothetical protein DFH09DRAFT_1319176 [Mycena vulgaris]